MKTLFSAICSVALLAGAAFAAPIDHNGVSYTANQGLQTNGSAVAADRSDLTAAFDGNSNTFYSLGMGGSVTGVAQTGLQFDPEVDIIEITFGTVSTTYPESAKLEFFDANGVQASVQLFNNGANVSSCGSAAGLTCVASQTSNSTIWKITLAGAFEFTKVVITDTTNPASYNPSRPSDGFDIGELRIATVAANAEVPEPGTISMIGLGLGLVALAYRKRAARS